MFTTSVSIYIVNERVSRCIYTALSVPVYSNYNVISLILKRVLTTGLRIIRMSRVYKNIVFYTTRESNGRTVFIFFPKKNIYTDVFFMLAATRVLWSRVRYAVSYKYRIKKLRNCVSQDVLIERPKCTNYYCLTKTLFTVKSRASQNKNNKRYNFFDHFVTTDEKRDYRQVEKTRSFVCNTTLIHHPLAVDLIT